MSELLKQAKRSHKEALKNKAMYKIKRDNLVRHMLECETPNWGSLKIIMIDL